MLVLPGLSAPKGPPSDLISMNMDVVLTCGLSETAEFTGGGYLAD